MTDAPASPQIDIRPVGPAWRDALESFLLELLESGDDRWFHPFPLDGGSAERMATSDGLDRYLIATVGDRVVALGMLRGWDDGFAVPSLGIAVGSTFRGSGVGQAMMTALHAEARRHGASRVRLTVDRANDRAVEFYKRLGYILEEDAPGHLVGWLELSS